MKFLKTKFFLIMAIAVVVLAVATGVLAMIGGTGLLRSVANTVAKPFVFCGSKVADAVNGFSEVFAEHDRLAAENEALRDQLESAEERDREIELLRQENAWLRDYLKIAEAHPEFTLVDATVIARESDEYATALTLNRGSVHGVKTGMSVITERGVFGYVKETGIDWCRVVSIIETATSVGAYTQRGGAIGVVEGDVTLRGDGRCRMTYIEATADILPGDAVYTGGGSGSQYPNGLLIGKVIEVEADENSRTLTALIEPAVDFSEVDSLTGVMVISGYAKEK